MALLGIITTMDVDPVHLFLSLSSETVFEFAATAGKAICSGFLA